MGGLKRQGKNVRPLIVQSKVNFVLLAVMEAILTGPANGVGSVSITSANLTQATIGLKG